MKSLLIFLFMFMITLSHAQNPILNPGFELWTNGTPEHWQTNNDLNLSRITMSSNSHSGNFAAAGTVLMGPSAGQFISPELIYTDSTSTGTPYQQYDQMSIFVAYTPLGSTESFSAMVMMFDSADGLTRIGSLTIESFNSSSTYTQYVCPLNPVSNNPSTKIVISISLDDTQGLIQGASFLVDDIELSVSSTTQIDVKHDRSFDVRIENDNLFISNQKNAAYTINIYSLDGRLLENVYQGTLAPGDFPFYSKHLKTGNILSVRSASGKSYASVIR